MTNAAASDTARAALCVFRADVSSAKDEMVDFARNGEQKSGDGVGQGQ
jgi:hypothetical protein